MSYLLTEIAMEMLGWQFYDTDGVARPINLEALNIAISEDAEPLEKALNIQFDLDQKTSVKAEADSSIEATYKEQDKEGKLLLNLFKTEPTRAGKAISDVKDSKSNELNINENNFILNMAATEAEDKPFMKIQSVVGGVDFEMPTNNMEEIIISAPETSQTSTSCSLNDFEMPSTEAMDRTTLTPVPVAIHSHPICDQTDFQKPFTNSVEHSTSSTTFFPINVNNFQESSIQSKPKTSKSSAKWNNISVSKLPCPQPDNKLSTHLTTVNNIKSQTETLTDFELQQIVESEMFKAALDVNREKSRFYKSLSTDSTAKANCPVLRKAIERYRTQELDNLKKELKNLYELRLKAEHLCITKFPKTYPKYLPFSSALSDYALLQKTTLTIPITSKMSYRRPVSSNVKKSSIN